MNVGAQEHLRDKSFLLRCINIGTLWLVTQHATEITSPGPISVYAEVEALIKK